MLESTLNVSFGVKETGNREEEIKDEQETSKAYGEEDYGYDDEGGWGSWKNMMIWNLWNHWHGTK